MATTISHGQAQTILRRLGFKMRHASDVRRALVDFQRAYNLGARLVPDGVLGPKTSAALLRCEAARRAGRPTASAHFSFAEFRCKCGGRYSTCRGVLVRRELLASLEVYRHAVGAVSIVSGYRCASHNRAVGGASQSQHLYGAAADVGYRLSDSQVRSLGAFAGIGRSASTHKVRHVDRRDRSGHNTTGASIKRPTIWNYAR